MSNSELVETRLNGFFCPDFDAECRVLGRIVDPLEGMLASEATPPTRIHDARKLLGLPYAKYSTRIACWPVLSCVLALRSDAPWSPSCSITFSPSIRMRAPSSDAI